MKHKNNIHEKERTRKKKKTFMNEVRVNDEEKERKCVLGFYCDKYNDIFKKRELIRLYYI